MGSRNEFRDWREYWKMSGESGLGDIRILSGYSHKLARLSDETLHSLLDSIVGRLEIDEGNKVLDVGCGAGVITVPLSSYAPNIIGVDATASMIQHMPKHIPRILGETAKLPFADETFDKVLCHSIFQYFPDLVYAKETVREMIRVHKKDGTIYIMDIPDKAKRQEYERLKEPESHNLTRLFYRKDFFESFPGAEIFNHELEGYENSKFRFNVLIRK